VRIAIFGGTFDPIHSGHVQAAKAAARRFRLNRILFVPTGHPPHKTSNGLTDFRHRFAMVALACEEDPRFVPSLLESPDVHPGLHYSINTVRRVRRMLRPEDKLYFLIGIDAWLDLPHWKQFRRLLGLADFIVVSRPGFDNHEIEKVVPPDLVSRQKARVSSHQIELSQTTVHILPNVEVPVASRDLRRTLQQKENIAGLVPPQVEQYILKEGLYSSVSHLRGGK